MAANKKTPEKLEPVLGIDIGGSGIKGALVDINRGVLVSDRLRIPTPEGAKPEDVANEVSDLVKQIKYEGVIGCGFPAVVLNGMVMTAANIDSTWIGKNVNDLLSVQTGQKVYVLNDADAAGMAEMSFGVGKDHQQGVVLMLTVGTGIGSALFIDGKLVPNTEMGHMEIDGKDSEKVASDAVRKRKELTWKAWGKRLSDVIARMEFLLWPDLIIIGGGVSKDADKFFPFLKVKAKIVPATLQNQAGIIGAAVYASSKISK